VLNALFVTINTWMTGGIGIAAVGCLLWGMVSVLLSPCHMASIPLMVGYVAGQAERVGTGRAARSAVACTVGLFITIAAVGVVCAMLGRMLGEVSPYWTILVGMILLWVAVDMLGVPVCSLSGGRLSRLKVKGLGGAFFLGLAYGILSGACTFGFIAPILAIITVQEKIITGVILIVLFGVGHCIPIAVAGSSTALVQRIMDHGAFQGGSFWFRKLAGVAIAILGFYFIVRPFIDRGTTI